MGCDGNLTSFLDLALRIREDGLRANGAQGHVLPLVGPAVLHGQRAVPESSRWISL